MKNFVKVFAVSVCLFFISLDAMDAMEQLFEMDEEIAQANVAKDRLLGLFSSYISNFNFQDFGLVRVAVNEFNIFQSLCDKYLGFLHESGRVLLIHNTKDLSWKAYPDISLYQKASRSKMVWDSPRARAEYETDCKKRDENYLAQIQAAINEYKLRRLHF